MKNILLFTTSLVNGGAEVFLVNLEKMLTDIGYNVTVVSTNKIELKECPENYFSLALTRNKYLNVIIKPFKLRSFIKGNNIDLLIDNRAKLNVFKTLFYEIMFRNTRKIKIIHSYNLSSYFFNAKVLNYIFFGNYNKIVCVSYAIEKKVKLTTGLSNVTFINNFVPKINIDDTKNLACDLPFILFYGRLDNKAKDLFFLIESYKESVLIEKGIKLVIMGNGVDKFEIQHKIKELNLQDFVEMKEYQQNPYHIVQKAMFTVMTSNFEGFPMTILESFSLNVPIVSTNFPGSEELIIDEVNGLLVEKNIQNYANALNRMVINDSLYMFCKNNCNKSISHLNSKIIGQRWDRLVREII